MPALFVGHGSPMNAIEDNEFSRRWREIGQVAAPGPGPSCASRPTGKPGARWSRPWKSRAPSTISAAFPRSSTRWQYPAPGSTWLAGEVRNSLGARARWVRPGLGVGPRLLERVEAHVPRRRSARGPAQPGLHQVGPGALCHGPGTGGLAGQGHPHLSAAATWCTISAWSRSAAAAAGDFNHPFGFDWAIEANNLFKELIDRDRHEELADYPCLGDAVRLAVPTPEHFLPLLYVLAVKGKGEPVAYFNDKPVAGSLTMTSFIVGQAEENE